MALTVYTSGEVLTASSLNANLSFAADSGGLQLISATTIPSAVSSVTITGAFSADFDNYKIIMSGGVSSANNDLNLRLGGAVTGYFNGYSRVTFSTGAAATIADNNQTSFSRGGFGTPDTLFSNLDLINPFATKRTIINGFVVAAGSGFSGGAFGGFLDNATSFTAFTFLATGGATMTGGTISVYGYEK